MMRREHHDYNKSILGWKWVGFVIVIIMHRMVIEMGNGPQRRMLASAK